jgi:3-hydroxyisobutyrate dehydrogenase
LTDLATNTIGLMGLGLLGEALARRLLQGGYQVVGFDIDRAKIDKLGSLKGMPAASASAVAKSCGPIVLAVFNTDQVEALLEGELVPVLGENSGRIVLCASTCDPDRIAALGKRLAARQIHLLETPVSGTSRQVSRGEGVGLIGGEARVLAQVQPIVQTMFPTFFHIGRLGDGGRAKLAVNLILGLNRLALAEGLVFAQRLGLDIEAFLKVARRSASYSQVMDTKGGRMVRGDFVPEGRVIQHLKDVHLMLDQARLAKQRLPLLEIHADVLQACVRNGDGDLDNSIVIEEIRRRRTE